MAFASEILGRILASPSDKRLAEGGKLEEKWGTFTNDSGSTGGEIDLECDNVLYLDIIQETASPAEPRIQLDTATAGKVTITTAADMTGRFKALCKYN